MTTGNWSQIPVELWDQLAQGRNGDDQLELDYSEPPGGSQQIVVHWPAEIPDSPGE